MKRIICGEVHTEVDWFSFTKFIFKNTVCEISASLFRRQFVDGLVEYMNTPFNPCPVPWPIKQDNQGCSNDCEIKVVGKVANIVLRIDRWCR